MKCMATMLVGLALGAVAPYAGAQPTEPPPQPIVGVSPPSRAMLDLYAQPLPATAVAKQVEAASLPLPLAVKRAESGYLQVTLGGQEWWVRAAQVRRSKAVEATCSAAPPLVGLVAGVPGAGQGGCGNVPGKAVP